VSESVHFLTKKNFPRKRRLIFCSALSITTHERPGGGDLLWKSTTVSENQPDLNFSSYTVADSNSKVRLIMLT
jgi:hypothetical protein